MSAQDQAHSFCGHFVASSSGRAECFRQDNHRSSTLGAYHHAAHRSTLASCSWAYQVQAGDVGLSLSTLHSSPLPVRSTNSCRWHSFSSASSFILPLTLYLSVRRGLSLSVIGRFRLRLSNFGMNLPATSPLPSLWRLSVVSLLLFCFVYHIRFYNLYC